MSVGHPEAFAFIEDGTGADPADQVCGVDESPAGLCGADELAVHGQPRGPGTRSFGHFVPKSRPSRCPENVAPNACSAANCTNSSPGQDSTDSCTSSQLSRVQRPAFRFILFNDRFHELYPSGVPWVCLTCCVVEDCAR
jgi:hypothetical protein